MHKNLLIFCVATILLTSLAAAKLAMPKLPMPQEYVDDIAGVINAEHKHALNGILQELEQKTGVQYIILTIETTGGIPIEDFSIDLAHNQWKLGQKGKDNGLLFTLAGMPNLPAQPTAHNSPATGQRGTSIWACPCCGFLIVLFLIMMFLGGGRGRHGSWWWLFLLPLLFRGPGGGYRGGGYGGGPFGGGFGGFGGGFGGHGGGFGHFGGGGGGGFGGGGATGRW